MLMVLPLLLLPPLESQLLLAERGPWCEAAPACVLSPAVWVMGERGSKECGA